ncbi:MAG: ChbG/HpnK family deacetylase [Phocaeicola sp.]|nr:ChbG/HpnK family deacetylase [Phocaeicola sp.]
MIRLIINADDFGKSPWRNRAIDDAFKMGLISSAGLIVTGKHLKVLRLVVRPKKICHKLILE